MPLPFLTALDPQARVAGSRDPLGVQPIWGHLGRELVSNLTTVATSVRGFTTLMLGLHYASRLVDEAGHDEAQRIRYFLKFEQMVAWSRYAWQDETGDTVEGIRGIRRVRRTWEGGERKPPLGLGPDAQILSDQKTYGLWGLFSMPARDSRLRERVSARLTEPAREHLLPRLDAALSAEGIRNDAVVIDLLGRDQHFEPTGRHKALGRALAAMTKPAWSGEEEVFYLDHLVQAGRGADGRQARLWGHLATVNDRDGTWKAGFGMEELRRVRTAAGAAGDTDIVERLTWIADVEAVLAPAGLLFSTVLGAHGQRVADVAAEVEARWGAGLGHVDVDGVRAAIPQVAAIAADGTAERLDALSVAFRDGAWAEAITLVIAQNKAVMEARRAGPWATEKAGTLDVRFRTDGDGLAVAADLPDLWVNPYYLSALKHVGGSLLRRGVRETSVDGE